MEVFTPSPSEQPPEYMSHVRKSIIRLVPGADEQTQTDEDSETEGDR